MSLPWRTSVAWRVLRLLEHRSILQLPVEQVRTAAERRSSLLRLPGSSLIVGRPDPGATVEDSSMTLDDATVLPIRVYRPRDVPEARPGVVLNFHGGGWVSGDPRQSEWWCSALAAQAGVVVVSVAYRLAPEHPFPTPPEDCYAATAWVAAHAGELGVDGTRLAVMGDSAGGNLAAVVAIMARERGGPPIALQVLIYPAVDLVGDYPSKHENATAPILTRKDMDHACTLYLHGTDADPRHPHASPLNAEHHDLPPALIQTAQYDPLRDQGPAYAAALRAAGVAVRLTNYVDAVHGYISLPTLTVGGRQALAEAVGEVRRVLG